MVEKPNYELSNNLNVAQKSLNEALDAFRRSEDDNQYEERLNHLLFAKSDVISLESKGFKNPNFDALITIPILITIRIEQNLISKSFSDDPRIRSKARQKWLKHWQKTVA